MTQLLQNLRTTEETQSRELLRYAVPIAPTSLTAAGVDLFTNSTSEDFFIEDLWFANVSAGASTYTLNIVPDGGSVASTNRYASAAPLAVNTTAHIGGVIMLSPGDTLTASCATNADINAGGWGNAQRGIYG